ncbi:Family with sequence similarity 69 member C [Halocaridina rubra]|uniref:Family with sequence similarity 69 member C n=1 Tax=Halocaridina rubra TaxID=373956 RepID=A0AAN9A1K4_HALRR
MLNNRRKRRKCIFWTLVFGILISLFIAVSIRDVLIASSFICTTEDVLKNHINNLCLEVKNEVIVSNNLVESSENLCEDLCVEDISSKVECKTFHLNKPTVFTYDNGRKKIVKSAINAKEREEAVSDSDDVEEEYWNSKSTQPYFPTKDEFTHMVNIYIGNFIDGEVNQDMVLSLLSHSNVYQTNTESLSTHKNFWLLTQDHEYLTSIIFEEYNLFPKVLSTCGAYYSMEYFTPLTENAMRPYKLQWRERLWKALDIMKYVGQLENAWVEPLHICDVKHDHFGWSEDGKVRFLDLDSIFTESVLLKTMENTPVCINNEDCSYFDCKGRCHVKMARCELERTNTNLQVICDKIFLGNTDGLISLYGLLVSHEANEELSEALEICRTNRGMTFDGMMEVITKASNHLMY